MGLDEYRPFKVGDIVTIPVGKYKVNWIPECNKMIAKISCFNGSSVDLEILYLEPKYTNKYWCVGQNMSHTYKDGKNIYLEHADMGDFEIDL
jgi:hypothetical protein